MSTTRNLLQQLTRRAPSTIVPHARYSTRIAARPIPQPPKLHLRPTQTYVQIRWHSVSQPAQPQLEPSSPPKQYDFEDVKSLSSSPSPKRILIDVREPAEFAAGAIPSAINVPFNSQPDGFFLPADEFEDRFGVAKPSAEQEVVFYCKSGVRSTAASLVAGRVGYKNVGNYKGSWLDWEKKTKGGQA